MSAVRDFMVRMGIIGRGMFRSDRLLELANGAPCMHCTAQDGTVVAAHANWPEFDKGGHNKAHDCFVAYLCKRCHDWIDFRLGVDPTGVFSNSPDDRKEAWRRAHYMTLLFLFMTRKVRAT